MEILSSHTVPSMKSQHLQRCTSRKSWNKCNRILSLFIRRSSL